MHVYIYIDTRVLYILKGSPQKIYKKGPYIQSMPYTCSWTLCGKQLHIYIYWWSTIVKSPTYIELAVEIIHRIVLMLCLLNSLNYIDYGQSNVIKFLDLQPFIWEALLNSLNYTHYGR